jgi:hypothetical protein
MVEAIDGIIKAHGGELRVETKKECNSPKKALK